jgi:hypothetical protein
MYNSARRAVAVLLSAACFVPLAVSAAGVEVLFDRHDRSKTMFPSDQFTVFDGSQNTRRRVNLAQPDCSVNVVRCWDIDVLNTLDGFNTQPRLSIPFSGPIDVSSVDSDSVFLVSLGSTLGGGSFGDRIGINQIVWDPQSNTLHAESDELLEQHTRYALVVTDRVRDAQGDPVQSRRFHGHGVGVVAASIFTTQSITATLEKIHAQINASTPAPASFSIGLGGERAVFPLSSVTSVLFNRQNTVAPLLTTISMPIQALGAIPGAVGSLAFGSYSSPDYHAPGEFIPPAGTRTGVPLPQRMNTIYFNLVLPAGSRPAAGWPVAIFGHGFGDSRHNSPLAVAASMAAQGIATIAINVVGHGGGPLGTVTVNRSGGAPAVSFPAGGRGIDQNGDGVIGSTEGSAAGPPRLLIGSADALRQTVVDLMQLVRQIQVGVDVDGDGAPDLDPARIYYFGQSFGGMYGTIFLGVERDVRVGVPNVPGGAVIDIVRLAPGFRFAILTPAVGARGLFNLPPITLPDGTVVPLFNENLPLRDQPALINNVPGAMALQDFFEQSEWGSQVGNPVAYAPYLRKSPLRGNPVKAVIYQIAKGDQTVPNPTNTAIIRAGDLQDRTTYFRHDLAFAINPAPNLGGVPKNPHTFLTNIGLGGFAAAIALKAQAQIATFFASDGALINDPDPVAPGLPPLFETPIIPPLPEALNFLP